MDAHLDWVPGSGRHGLAKAVRATIRDGRWRAGAVVPSTRALARDLGVARGTVSKVYADLAAEGYLRTSQGAPTRVATAGMEPSPRPRLGPAANPGYRWTLLPGRLDAALFPRSRWLVATRRVLQHTPNQSFDYGDPRGSPELRAALSGYLGRARGVLADPARMVICAGYSQAMPVLAWALREAGITEMAFEDPSFMRFRDLASAAGQQVVGVPVDEAGLRVEALSSPAVVVTPAHQAPLGVTMAPARRTALVRHGAVVIEDDYDGEFRYDRHPVGAMQALAPERVIYAGTASETLSPSLRLAWLVLPRSLVDPARCRDDRHRRPPASARPAGSRGHDRLSRVRPARAPLPAGVPVQARPARRRAAEPADPRGISAGLHLVLPLSSAAEAAVPSAARVHSVALATLSPRLIRPDGEHTGLIVGYGAPSAHSFGGALEALLAVLDEIG